MNTEKTIVIFRKDSPREGGQVFALFPEIPGTNEPHTCSCFQHVGQHSSADYAGMLQASHPAKSQEYAALKAELESEPYWYILDVRTKATSTMRRKREQELSR